MRKGKKIIIIKPKPPQSVCAPACPTLLARARGVGDSAAGGSGGWRSLASIASHVLGDEAQDRMCFITVNNDPDYCLGLPYLKAIGAARCRQPSRKPQRFI